MNGFVAFSAIGIMGLSVEQSLGAVFWSGVLCILLTWMPMRERIISLIPRGLQSNLALSVGIFVATIGLYLSRLVVFEKGAPCGIGSFSSAEAISLYLGLAVTLILRTKALSAKSSIWSGAAFLIAIIVSTIWCSSQGVSADKPLELSWSMLENVGKLSLFRLMLRMFLPSF